MPGDVASDRTTLTPQEYRVLCLMAEGLDRREIAWKMELGSETVKTHQRSLYKKLGANNRTHAVAIAVRQGIIR